MGTELRHLVASAVEAARLHAGVSFIELSERARIAPAALTDLLEERADFTMEDLAGIATVLGVPVTRLLPCAP
ncbi:MULTISPECIES: helix-turn-helix transcriptional regulator [unclassified Microbacterium]|uniref:helix-turn-helix domain-containing protein n=1 Tax=unclassified Microbacterium TaxID=2609290 RepID=UPI0021A313DD|nr:MULTISPECIES: helix-turn-helix transcriptional regulator [unclassified Microbacterium]MCT1363158.1 helix-turn-helix transcriptional regulator [Microbacterium sp. p3-SID131]MCT1376513.1 helix-turn-helix transcriptional regulator [Microbacterium sp. p3-SID337]